MNYRSLGLMVLLPLGIVLCLHAVIPAALAVPSAPTFTVNSDADVGADPADTVYTICRTSTANAVCTLRAAIDKANKYPGGGVTIKVPALPIPGKYLLSIGALVISNSMTIAGAG